MTNYTDLKNDPVIIQWIDIIRKKPKTVDNYLIGFNQYIQFTGLTPDELLTEAEDEASKQIIMRRRKILTRLLGFRKYLENNFAPTSVRNYINCVVSFYKAFYVEVPKLQGNNVVEPKKENTKQILKDDICDVLKVADVLEKAIVLTGISSGLAAADICNLRISDFKGNYDPETGITTLKLRRTKTGVLFCTFLTPEASNAVNYYIKFRNRAPKKGMNPVRRTQLEKQLVTRDEGYLFVLRNISDKYLEMPCGTDEQWQAKEDVRKYTDDSFNRLYARLSEKCGKENPNGWAIVRSHNMRKYFNSALINAGFDFYFVDHMLGHKANSTDRTYFWHDADQLKERFKTCVPYLTIQKETDISESQEYLRIKQENQILQAETARHVVERSELQELRTEIEKMKPIDSELERLLEKKMEEMVETRLNELLAKIT